MRVLELRGFKALRAFNAFNVLMLGIKMLPMYMGETYETFLQRVQDMDEPEQRKILRQAAQFVNLEQEEIEALLCFATDKNGVPYDKSNLKNLSPSELVNVIENVCFEIAKIKVDMITDDEKKN